MFLLITCGRVDIAETRLTKGYFMQFLFGGLVMIINLDTFLFKIIAVFVAALFVRDFYLDITRYK